MPTPPISPSIRINNVIASAKDLPDLIHRLSALDPDAAEQLKGKALVGSKSIWGTLAAMVVSWLVSKYALGWDPETCAEVSGLIVMAAVTVLRYITSSPITGIVSTPAPPSAEQP